MLFFFLLTTNTFTLTHCSFSKIIIFQLPPEIGLGLPNITDPKIKKEPMESSLSPYHRYTNTISPSPQPLSPATPAILNETSYNITPNITQFHSMRPQFVHTNQSPIPQFNQNHFNIPPIISAMKSSPTTPTNNNNDPATYSNSTTEPNALSLLLDLDNQQFTPINSGDLASISLSLLDGHYDASATDCARADNQMEQENMTDSFTRFAIRESNDLSTFSNKF